MADSPGINDDPMAAERAIRLAELKEKRQPHLIYDKPNRTIVAASPGWVCAARKQSTVGGNDPTDCNWPFCGCDPYADKVLAAIQESGYLIAKPAD